MSAKVRQLRRQATSRWPTWCVPVPRWTAWIWALAAFLIWGAFFVDHLGSFGRGGFPSPSALFLEGVHLLLLVGLLLGWKWELAGGGIVVAAAVVFFAFTAGSNFIPFSVLTAAPGLLWLGCALSRK